MASGPYSGLPPWLSGFGTFGSPAQAAPGPMPVPSPGPTPGPTPVSTFPVDPSTLMQPQSPGGTMAPTKPADEGARKRLMDMYMSKMQEMNAPAAEETTKDKIARMLINFGRGTTAGASRTRGRSVGPSTLEAASFGGAALGEGELDERDRKAGADTKRGKDARSMLEKAIGLHSGLDKAQRAKAKSAFDRYYKKRSLDIREKKSGNFLQKELIKTIPGLVEEHGIDEAMRRVKEALEGVNSNPDLAKLLGSG